MEMTAHQLEEYNLVFTYLILNFFFKFKFKKKKEFFFFIFKNYTLCFFIFKNFNFLKSYQIHLFIYFYIFYKNNTLNLTSFFKNITGLNITIFFKNIINKFSSDVKTPYFNLFHKFFRLKKLRRKQLKSFFFLKNKRFLITKYYTLIRRQKRKLKKRKKKRFKKIKIIFHKFRRFRKIFKYNFYKFTKKKSKYLANELNDGQLFTDRSIIIFYFYSLVKKHYFNKFKFININKKKRKFKFSFFFFNYYLYFFSLFFFFISKKRKLYNIFTHKKYNNYNLKKSHLITLSNIFLYFFFNITAHIFISEHLKSKFNSSRKLTIVRILSYKIEKVLNYFKNKFIMIHAYRFKKSKNIKLFNKNINLLFKLKFAFNTHLSVKNNVTSLLVGGFVEFFKSNKLMYLFSKQLNFKNFFFTNVFLVLKKRWRFLKNLKKFKKKFSRLFFYKTLKKTNVPIFDFYKSKLKRKIASLFSSKSIFDVTKFLYNYILNFCEFLLKIKTIFTISTNNKEKKIFFLDDALISLLRLMKHYHIKVGKGLFLQELIEITLISFFKKDLFLLKNWLKSTMEKMILKKHKKFIILLKYLFQKYLWKHFISFDCKGFKLYLSGKISVTGNSKTRSCSILWGAYSLTKKKFKLDYIQEIIRTNTGVLGLTMLLTY